MENEAQKNDELTMRSNILKRLKSLERNNYSKKPDGGKSDREMVEFVKKIIEEEVDKCL